MQNEDGEGGSSLDPVALTLVLWLSLVTGVAGMTRLSQQAAAQASFNQAVIQQSPPLPVDSTPLLASRALAFGG